MPRKWYICAISSVIRQGAAGHHSRRWQQAVLTRGPSLPPDTGFGTNVSLLMAAQQCEPVPDEVVVVWSETVAVP